MTETITNSILSTLHAEFGGKYMYYNNSIEQGIKRPCFFIEPLTFTHKKGVGARYYLNYLYDIRYYPSTDSPKTEIYAVQERLWWCLENIKDDVGRIRTKNMKANTIDDVLHFTTTFNMCLSVIRPQNSMQKLNVESGVKGGD